MNIQKYLSFVKTVEYGSFTKAAEILNYSQSGISRMIADLEKEWKVVLLKRSKNGIELTSDGTRLLPYVKSIVNEYEKLRMQVDSLNNLQTGLIRIGTFSSVATHWLPNIIKKFQNDYPNIEYELLLGDYAETERRIFEGRVDCGFLSLPVPDELETIFIERDPFSAIIPENHKLAQREKVSLSELCEYPFILLEKGGRSEVNDLFKKRGLTPDIRFITWDDYAVMSMVECGLGISILPNLILKRVPYKILTKELDVHAYRDIGLVLKNKKDASLAVKRFIDYLKYR